MSKDKKSRISIQVSLSGYSFKIYNEEKLQSSSSWQPAGSIFTTKEFQRRYDEVEIAIFAPKCTLVPSQFFTQSEARFILAGVCQLSENDVIHFVPVPQFASVLVYSTATGETLSRAIRNTVLQSDGNPGKMLPEMFYLLDAFSSLEEYNKIIASYCDGFLYLAVGQGKSLLLCNTYEAPDFTTAEYYIFMVMKKLQLNPELSTITFRTPLTQEEQMSLYRYFKSVELI